MSVYKILENHSPAEGRSYKFFGPELTGPGRCFALRYRNLMIDLACDGSF